MRLDGGGALAAMFAEVDRQLSAQGIRVRPTRGALVDAGIVREKGLAL